MSTARDLGYTPIAVASRVDPLTGQSVEVTLYRCGQCAATVDEQGLTRHHMWHKAAVGSPP